MKFSYIFLNEVSSSLMIEIFAQMNVKWNVNSSNSGEK